MTDMAQENKQSRYLEYLPALFHSDDGEQEGSWLGQFLLPFEQVLSGFEAILSTIDDRISPALAPDDFVPWLASWVALTLDHNWDEHKQRQLIRNAVKLYRYRGMVAGLKDYLEIYDERLQPTVHEGRWPGGMQIGVASQIGGLVPEHVPLSKMAKVERRLPPRAHDYYIVDTVASAGHAHVPEGEPLRLYHRADRVKSVHIGKHEGETFVRLELVDGESRLYHPASITRHDGLVDECYTIVRAADPDSGKEKSEPIYYRGSTILVEDVELPYCFTLEIGVPCQDWEVLFPFHLEKIEKELPKAFWHELEIHGISLAKDATVTEEQGLTWWRIADGDPKTGGQIVVAIREGTELDVYRWSGREAWEQATHPHKVRAIRAIVDEVKPAHTTYYLKFTPLVSESVPQSMQVGVRSTIDVDARIG
jgi:phage tail-like protein